MAGTVLLVLTEGFDDMAFLSHEVILKENGNDVIISSKSSDAIKGNDSSVMTVSLKEALDQDVAYSALIVIGGNDLLNWPLLLETVKEFNQNNKIIGAVAEGVDVLKQAFDAISYSNDDNIVVDNNIYSLKNPSNVEEFAELISNQT